MVSCDVIGNEKLRDKNMGENGKEPRGKRHMFFFFDAGKEGARHITTEEGSGSIMSPPPANVVVCG